ncbi:MAG TPA: LuxR C-terminal-related transcriptional regulator [Gaiellaceae bacterium]|nr:LuxR C-terminal-related transcriptional regulator [Gaiellaceae bacterium]
MTEARDAVLTPLFRRHTRRPRLTSLLDETKAQSILLTAPAGYGKTTLAREWLQGRENVAWYHATSASADVGAFSAGLAEAVGPVVPGAGERVRRRLRVGDATERLARPLAELLAEDLEAWPDGGIIVLDDYHFLAESTPVEDFLDWLLTLAPIRVLVTGRRRPGWATARRFLYGEAAEIGRDQLAMTAEEAGRVLAGRSTEAVRALVRQAEGWPALIGLAALSADLAFPAERMSESLFRYFAEEVLRREPPDVQRFMLVASVGSAVGVRLAREVLGFDDPEPILEGLRDEDLLHEAATEGELRFHPLLREFLRRRLQAEDPDAFADLALRVIDDARECARWEDAFAVACEVGRTEEAAEILGLAARPLLATGQSETLEKWLASCGAAGVIVPGAVLARAELLIREGEMSTAAALAQDTVRRLAEEHHDYAWACNVAGRALHFTSREQDAFRMFAAARARAKSKEDVKEALWGLLLTSTEIHPETMGKYLDELETRYSDDIDIRYRVATGRYGAAEQTASIAGEWDRLSALLPSIQHVTDPLAASGFLVITAAAANLRGRYSEARSLAQRALSLCRELHIEFGVGVCLAYRAVAEIGLRRFSEARRSLDLFHQSAIRREDPFILVEGLTIEARLLATIGALDAALRTADEMPLENAPPRAKGTYLATRSIILAALGRVDEAQETAQDARSHCTNIETHHGSMLGESIAAVALRPTNDAKNRLTESIIACGQADYIDGVVFAYRLYPHLLQMVRDDAGALNVLKSALTYAGDFAIARSAQIAVKLDRPESLSALSPRELEVLALLSQGMSNEEIARALYIARSTAKVHVRNILRKLGVRNRLQAVIQTEQFLRRPD